MTRRSSFSRSDSVTSGQKHSATNVAERFMTTTLPEWTDRLRNVAVIEGPDRVVALNLDERAPPFADLAGHQRNFAAARHANLREPESGLQTTNSLNAAIDYGRPSR